MSVSVGALYHPRSCAPNRREGYGAVRSCYLLSTGRHCESAEVFSDYRKLHGAYTNPRIARGRLPLQRYFHQQVWEFLDSQRNPGTGGHDKGGWGKRDRPREQVGRRGTHWCDAKGGDPLGVAG
jgi:hypothetical protein